MEIQLNDTVKIDVFANIFQNIKSVCDQINIDFNDERMYIQTMDASKISILEITILSTWFTEYKCTTPVTIGVSASLFYKIMTTRDKSQMLRIVHDSDVSSETLHFYMFEKSGETKTAFDRSFDIPLIDLEVETMTIPSIDYAADFSMPANSFSQLVVQLKTFGESIDIQCNEQKIALIAKSENKGKWQ